MHREIEAANLRQHDEQNAAIVLAWNIERIRLATKRQRSGKKETLRIIDLKKVLLPEPGSTKTTRRKQSISDMKAQLAVLAERYKIPLRPRRG